MAKESIPGAMRSQPSTHDVSRISSLPRYPRFRPMSHRARPSNAPCLRIRGSRSSVAALCRDWVRAHANKVRGRLAEHTKSSFPPPAQLLSDPPDSPRGRLPDFVSRHLFAHRQPHLRNYTRAFDHASQGIIDQGLIPALPRHRLEVRNDRRVEHDADALFANPIPHRRLPLGLGNIFASDPVCGALEIRCRQRRCFVRNSRRLDRRGSFHRYSPCAWKQYGSCHLFRRGL